MRLIVCWLKLFLFSLKFSVQKQTCSLFDYSSLHLPVRDSIASCPNFLHSAVVALNYWLVKPISFSVLFSLSLPPFIPTSSSVSLICWKSPCPPVCIRPTFSYLAPTMSTTAIWLPSERRSTWTNKALAMWLTVPPATVVHLGLNAGQDMASV